MKKQPSFILFLLAFLLTVSLPSNATEKPTANDRSSAANYLKENKEKLLKTVAGLSAQQLLFKADSTRWSIAECLEHIALSETAIFMIAQTNLKKPAEPDKRAEIKVSNEDIAQRLANRGVKVKAPEVIKPTGKFATSTAAIEAFMSRRDQTIAYLETTQDDLENHFWQHPATGTIDLCQTLVFIGAHCERHRLQIEEVKASAGFPK